MRFRPGTGVLVCTAGFQLFMSVGVRAGAKLVQMVKAGADADTLIGTIQESCEDLGDLLLFDLNDCRVVDQSGAVRNVCQSPGSTIRSGDPVDLLGQYELSLGIVPADGVELVGWKSAEADAAGSPPATAQVEASAELEVEERIDPPHSPAQPEPLDASSFPDDPPSAATFDPFADPQDLDLERVGEPPSPPGVEELDPTPSPERGAPLVIPTTYAPSPEHTEPPPPPPPIGVGGESVADRTVVDGRGAFALDPLLPAPGESDEFSMLLTFDDGRSVHATGPVIVGRKPSYENDEDPERDTLVIVDDESVSRRHVTLWPEKNGVFVKDLGSLNGTYVGSNLPSDVQLTPNKAQLVPLGSVVSYGERFLTLQER